jgi:hypothetical protein
MPQAGRLFSFLFFFFFPCAASQPPALFKPIFLFFYFKSRILLYAFRFFLGVK